MKINRRYPTRAREAGNVDTHKGHGYARPLTGDRAAVIAAAETAAMNYHYKTLQGLSTV